MASRPGTSYRQRRSAYLIRNACTIENCQGYTQGLQQSTSNKPPVPLPPSSPSPSSSPRIGAASLQPVVSTSTAPPMVRVGGRYHARRQSLHSLSSLSPASPESGLPTSSPPNPLQSLHKLISNLVQECSIFRRSNLKLGASRPFDTSADAFKPQTVPDSCRFWLLGSRCCQHILLNLLDCHMLLNATMTCSTLAAAGCDRAVWQTIAERQLATVRLSKMGRSHRVYSCAPLSRAVSLESAREVCWRLSQLQRINEAHRALYNSPQLQATQLTDLAKALQALLHDCPSPMVSQLKSVWQLHIREWNCETALSAWKSLAVGAGVCTAVPHTLFAATRTPINSHTLMLYYSNPNRLLNVKTLMGS